MAVLKDRRHECVAQALFCMKTPEEASHEAGYDHKASSFAPNARKRAQREDIKGRVAELQSQAAACSIVDVAWIKGKAAHIAGVPFDADKIKPSDAVAALNLLAKMTPDALVPSKGEFTGKDGAPLVPDYTDEDRIKALGVLFARHALNPEPAK